MVTVERLESRAKTMSQPVMRSGWQSGISSGVRLAAMMPAVRATPSTSPLASWPARTAARVAAFLFRGTGAGAGRRLPDGLRLGGDCHHSRLTGRGQVREAAEPGHIPRRAHRSGAGPD